MSPYQRKLKQKDGTIKLSEAWYGSWTDKTGKRFIKKLALSRRLAEKKLAIIRTDMDRGKYEDILRASASRGKTVLRVVTAPADSKPQTPPAPLGSIGGLQQLDLIQYPPCVYFLCLRGEVVYVGQTKKLVHRINYHDTYDKKEFDSIYWVAVPAEKLTEVEQIYIGDLQPKLNSGGLQIEAVR